MDERMDSLDEIRELSVGQAVGDEAVPELSIGWDGEPIRPRRSAHSNTQTLKKGETLM